MNSLDTNILFYGINQDCSEHKASYEIIESALLNPEQWVIADQVWFELYRLLRNPKVLEHPLSTIEATQVIQWYREQSGWLHCAWEPEFMDELVSVLRNPSFPPHRLFDAVLAITLKAHGVTIFYTRNTKDFQDFNFFQTIDPLNP